MQVIDLTGQVFGRLRVVARSGNSSKGQARWLCVCSCGSTSKVFLGSVLRRGDAVSCGCYQAEAHIVHGMSRSPEYRVWKTMHRRCEVPNWEGYARYGGRGITVDPAWADFDVFYLDVGPRPSDRHELERKENSQGYSAANCCWATKKENANNRDTNVHVVYQGQKLTLSQAARAAGFKFSALRQRHVRGLTEQTGLFAPLKRTL